MMVSNECAYYCRLAWIKVLGTTYRTGGVVVLSVDLLPTFGLIADTVIFDVDNNFIMY